jgi:hypothetical protein
MKKYDNSLLEVWAWKEQVSKTLLNLSVKQRFEEIKKNQKIRQISTKHSDSATVNTPIPRKSHAKGAKKTMVLGTP